MQFEKNKSNIGYVLASCLQPRDQLEKEEGKNDVVSTYIQKKKVGNAEEKTSKKDRERKSSRRTSVQKVLEVKENIWKEEVGKNIHKKTIELYNKTEGRVCAEERKDVLTIKRGKRESTSICKRPVTKGIYSAIKITIDLTSLFCNEEGWKKENSTRLLLYKSINGKEQISLAFYHRYPRWSRKKENVHETGSQIGIQQYKDQGRATSKRQHSQYILGHINQQLYILD